MTSGLRVWVNRLPSRPRCPNNDFPPRNILANRRSLMPPSLPMTLTPPIQRDVPDKRGRFGKYGGQFVPETLMAALGELETAYRAAREDESFWEELSNCPIPRSKHSLNPVVGRCNDTQSKPAPDSFLGRRIFLRCIPKVDRQNLFFWSKHFSQRPNFDLCYSIAN